LPTGRRPFPPLINYQGKLLASNGLPVSTESSPALESYDRAVDGLLAWDRQALDLFRAATACDPGLALGHAGASVCLFLEERFDEAIASAKVARAAAATQTDRERRHGCVRGSASGRWRRNTYPG